MFSRRTAVPRVLNGLSRALDQARSSGRAILDLTISNPTTAGLPYDQGRILAALADPRALEYRPSPFGRCETRSEIARLYAEDEVTLDPSRIVLTASTSEAYSFLFKILCDDGDDVLVPEPSYPLFEMLARFEGVKLSPYSLAYDGRWHIDMPSVKSAIGPSTRAILLVHPNNPTGSYVSPDEFDKLADAGLPLVSDEVFAPFVLSGVRRPSALCSRAGLVFALNGLSKMAALPQMKLAWIGIGGRDEAQVIEATERLELLGDSFLSASAPIQIAAAEMLAQRHATTDAILKRLRTNLATLQRLTEGTAATTLDVEGGWYATVRLPDTRTEETWALRFLDEGVYVHPGHFFDFPREPYFVVSLLTPTETFAEGVARILTVVGAA